ncbi:ACP S-malonyltransferase [Cryobacterium melibiosiphilum]|uniref:[acyl-carrier-protein] S-malonyltransferase n=1 Tax=Cryobacterium melibiosiphilum TaxID=995039 RepID=A0A3A5MIF0_9MICO|nr:ACP S-malonyltransferase [Cryobacterium melibiosiphilum]RJT87689.1 ACP S-malonyltransferase [Cryobacterium melibiosiphilum]
MIVVVCPGQGSQTPGFLEPWLPYLGDELSELSEAAGFDLVEAGTVSDADTIRDTAIAQPLLVAAGILTLDLLLADGRREKVAGIAGHSVGEITAAAGAGILPTHEAIRFVRERGLAMQAAAALEPTGMSAVLGGDEAELLALLQQLGLEPANFNGGGQIVVAGAMDALASLAANPPAKSRIIPLSVAGAFHTRYMRPALDRLSAVASTLTAADPTLPIWTNNDGSVVSDGNRFVELLVGQVSSSVRWDRCMQSFSAADVTGIIEVAPAGALTGLAKRALRGIPSVAIKTPDDLPAAFAMLDQQA